MRGRGCSKNTKKTCVVIFASEDESVALKIVTGLEGEKLTAWSSAKINHGSWNKQVREKIRCCDVVIPIVTQHTASKDIFMDEWRYAESLEKPIFPFVIDPAGTPFGMGQYSRTDAQGWDGDFSHPGFCQLQARLNGHFGENNGELVRLASISVGKKSLIFPSFVFSLSSFETQLDPINGLELMADHLTPATCLISAYDVHDYVTKRTKNFRRSVNALHLSNTVMFLDSGHYEATRKNDYRSTDNSLGWSPERFWEAANAIPADLVFSYDNPEPKGSASEVIDEIFRRYTRDWLKTGLDPGVLCPIVHVPMQSKNRLKDITEIISTVAKEIRPTLIAIPERELGNGLLARMRSVKAIRAKLNELGFYQPLHILGTGNPITIAALAVCGGDSFDGLEWCRTAANYETNNLLHFQQFDLLNSTFGGRISNSAARSVVELDSAPFSLRVASYNYDYFCDWMSVVQHWVHSPQPERLFQSIQYFGAELTAEYLHEKP